jgi:[protein-PII] uridylyltransferase
MEATALSDSELFDREGLESRLSGGGSPVTAFRGALKNGREVLRRRYLDGCHASELVTQQTTLVDTLVVRAWRHLALADSPEVALVAVGGYGRGELFPCSDVDLLILLRRAFCACSGTSAWMWATASAACRTAPARRNGTSPSPPR